MDGIMMGVCARGREMVSLEAGESRGVGLTHLRHPLVRTNWGAMKMMLVSLDASTLVTSSPALGPTS